MKKVISLLLILCLSMCLVLSTEAYAKTKLPKVHADSKSVFMFLEIQGGQKCITFGNSKDDTELVKVVHKFGKTKRTYKKVMLDIVVKGLKYYKINVKSYKKIKKGSWILYYKSGKKVKFKVLSGL